MGGEQSVEQVRTIVEKRMLNVVSNTMVKKTSNVDQSSSRTQIIRNVDLRPPPSPCPAGFAPGGYSFSNKATVSMSTAISMTNMNTASLVDAIKEDLEDQADAALKNEKAGSLAVGDSTKVSQKFSISEETTKNITNNINMQLQTYLKQRDDGVQVIEGMRLYQPCLAKDARYPEVTNEAIVTMMATDVAMSTADVVMNSEEIKRFITESKGSLDNKNKGADAILGDVLNNLISTVGSIGMSGIIVWGLVLVALVFFLPMILRALTGGGGGGGGGGAPPPPDESEPRASLGDRIGSLLKEGEQLSSKLHLPAALRRR